MLDFYVDKHSPVHHVDARVKVILTLAGIVLINLSPPKAWPAYILFYSGLISIALLTRIKLSVLSKRGLLALPLIVSAIPLVFWGPEPHMQIPLLMGITLNISQKGLFQFLSILIKSWISVQIAFLLISSTRFPDILRAMRAIRIPVLLLTIMGLMWRYLFVIIDEAKRLLRARASRSVSSMTGSRQGGSLAWRAKTAGGMAGNLFLRSLERSDRVYAAMYARGYNGQPMVMENRPLYQNERWMTITGLMLLGLVFLTGIFFGS